jgi:hypothetical protein
MRGDGELFGRFAGLLLTFGQQRVVQQYRGLGGDRVEQLVVERVEPAGDHAAVEIENAEQLTRLLV